MLSQGAILHHREVTAPNPRLFGGCQVAALPGWTEEHVNVWMDKGWTAQQIIEHHTPVAPRPQKDSAMIL